MNIRISLWKYRAFDSQFKMVNGIASSQSFEHLALDLRQKGLQIVSATTISRSEYMAELRLQRMKVSTNPQDSNNHKPQDSTSIRCSIFQMLKQLCGFKNI